MSEVSERYETIAGGFTARLNGIGEDQWSLQTPCTEWVVRDLVVHVVNTHRRVFASAEGSEPIDADASGDIAGQWRAASGAIREALADETMASKVVGGMFGEQSFESLVGRLLCTDTLVHTWDLARATGQDEVLNETAVARASEFLAPMDEAIRRPGGFAAKLAPDPSADSQKAFLNFCGRPV
jgi:uncharacterized protein (TIGR03086 family)